MQKTALLKTLFNLEANKQIGSEHTLLLEAGSDHCLRAYWHKESNAIDGLQLFSFDETETEDCLAQIVNETRERSVDDAVVCSAFSRALLVPAKFFQSDDSLLQSVYGASQQASLHDAVPEWQMTAVYSVPKRFYDDVRASFSSLRFFHAYTPAVKIYNGYATENQILVHFTSQHFRVLLKKDAAINLAQTYAYKTPLDVVYYLLKICYEFGLTQADLHVILSGLIQKDSALFAELQQYFCNLHFAQPPQLRLPDDSHPPHFFTSLYNLVSCAS